MNTGRYRDFIILICAIALTTGVCQSAEPTQSLSPPQAKSEPGPYCGINSVYGATRIYHKNISYSSLIDPLFVGGSQGSNLGELVAAVESTGLSATPATGVTISDLRTLEYPSILLLSRHRDSVSFHHWVLVLHAGRDRIRVMESPGLREDLSYAQLMAQWDGVALIVYPDSSLKETADRNTFARRWTFNFLIAMVVLNIFALRRFLPANLQTPDVRPFSALLRACVVCGFGAALALLWHTLSPLGFVRNSDGIALVKSRYSSKTLPLVSHEELAELIKGDRAMIIDARDEASFRLGHIPSAINVPVYFSPVALQEFANKIPPGRQVVVYCQSDSCEYDDQIGSQLYLMGVTKIALFRGGWREWKQHNSPSVNPKSELLKKQ